MASREEDRDRRIRKITSKDIEPGRELQEVTQAQNEISGINSELQNNLAMEQSEALARNNNNNILRQAAEIGLMGAAGGAIVQQVGNFNPTTQELLQKYGIKPGPLVNKVETRTTNQNFRSNTGGNTKIENTTNNTTNSRTDIEIVQLQIPMQQRQIAVSSQQAEPDANTTRFKTWLSGVFAKQQNDYEVQKKEYRKKEWNLNRSANRMMRRIETATKTFSEKMDPRNMGSSLSGQLKTLLFLFGTYMISKVWKPTMEIVANIETGFRSAFGLPINGDLAKSGAKTLSIIDSIKKFIGIDINTKEGRNTNLIEGIGKIFTQGIDRLIARIDLFMKDRQIAIKSVKFPNLDIDTSGLGVLSELFTPLKGILGGITRYLGDMLSAAFGGSSGMVTNASKNISRNSIKSLKGEGLQPVAPQKGDTGMLSGGKRYMRGSDFNSFGELKSDASSTLAMSQTLGTMINDKSGKVYTGAVSSGLEKLGNVIQDNGQAVIDPDLLLQLGLRGEDISQMKVSGQLKKKKYKFIKRKSTDDDLDDELSGNETGIVSYKKDEGLVHKLNDKYFGFFGKIKNYITDASARAEFKNKYRNSKDFKEGRLKAVPIDDPEESFDGSGIHGYRDFYVLTKEGFNQLKSKIGLKGDLDIKNKEFVDWVTKTLKTKKAINKVDQPLVLDQDFGEYNAAQARLGQYNKNVNWLYDPKHPEYPNINRFETNVKDVVSNVGSYFETGMDWAARKARELSGQEQKSRMMKAMNYLMTEHGLTKEQAAGLVGNFIRESGLKTDAVNPNGGAAGIAQWLGPRARSFEEVIGKKITDSSFEDQLRFVSWELNNTHRRGLEKIKSAQTPEEAAAAGFGYYEFSADPDGAVREMNKYGQNGKKSLIDGIQNALDVLYTYEKSAGINPTVQGSEIGKFSNVGETLAEGFEAVGNFIGGQKAETAKLNDNVVNLKNEQIEFRNKFFQNMYGAKIDESGIYIDNKDSRIYLNPESNSYSLDSNSISSVVKVNKDGIIEPGNITGQERDNIISETIQNIQDLLVTYTNKGTSADVLKENGKLKWISLGRFGDTFGFDPRVHRLYHELGGIQYTVLFSKDGKRVMQILTDSIKYPATIDGNSNVWTGSVLFKVGGFKTIDGEMTDWNPYFTSLGIGLTANAKLAIENIKRLFSEQLEIKAGKLYSKDTGERLDIDLAKKAGVIDKETGRISLMKRALDNFKGELDTDKYLQALGLNKLGEIQKEFESNPNKFWIDEETKQVFAKNSGLLVGSIENEKFIPTTSREIQKWIKSNPELPGIIRDRILNNEIQLQNSQSGLLGIDTISSVMESAYSNKISNVNDYNSWLTKNKRDGIILSQSIGGYKFNVKLNSDGSRIEAIKPELKKEGLGYHLIDNSGKLSRQILTKDPGWISVRDIKQNPNLIKEILGGSVMDQEILGKIGTLQWDLAKLITDGNKNVDISIEDQEKILNINSELKKLYQGESSISDNKALQDLVKSSRDKYLSGNTEGLITKEDGNVFTKEGILIGKLDKAGKLGEVSNKDIFEEMDKFYNENKPDFYKKWFGAIEDGGELVIEDGNKRVVLDMSKPLTKDWTKIIKDVQLKEDKDSSWKTVSDDFLPSLFGGETADIKKSKIINELKETIDKRSSDSEWAELIEKNNGNVEEALKEQSELAYKNQEIQDKLLDNAETQTKALLDIQAISRVVAEQGGVDLSGVNFSLANDNLGNRFGNRTSIEAGIKEKIRLEEKRKQEEKEKAQKAAMEGKSPLGPQIIDGRVDGRNMSTTSIAYYGSYQNPEATTIAKLSDPNS